MLGYWFEEDKVDNSYITPLSLSAANLQVFYCNMTKLKLESPNTSLYKRNFNNMSGSLTSDVITDQLLTPRPVTPEPGTSGPQTEAILVSLADNNQGFIRFTSGLNTETTDDECIIITPPPARSWTVAEDTQSNESLPIATPLTVYPNPFTHQLNIRFTADGLSEANLRIYDMGGRLMDQQTYQIDGGSYVSEVQYDGSQLQTGMYIYQLQLGETLKAGRIVKK